MQRVESRWVYSARDFSNFLECRRLPELELLVALEKRSRPVVEDAQAQLVREKALQHERAYLEQLRTERRSDVYELAYPQDSISSYRAAGDATVAAMREGRGIIYHATFFDGTFLAFAGFLQRVDTPSPSLGTKWSYEPVATTPALRMEPCFIITLCSYSEHLERVQGVRPKHSTILHGDGTTTCYTIEDHYAYYHDVKQRFLEFIHAQQQSDIDVPQTYPIKIEHCRVCVWNQQCAQKRADDDHLSLVARMRREQRATLEKHGIMKMADLAAADAACPSTMYASTFAQLKRQAQLQVLSRESGEPVVELLQPEPHTGFCRLPEPDAGDVYFDMEGDPMYEPHSGLEYLFGCWFKSGHFRCFWGRDRAEEKEAFESFIDFILERRNHYPKMHVYHYADYEKTALRRLAQQHNTRRQELEGLLRSQVFVDLYIVVRESMMVGEESYSIKKLERFYGMERATKVRKGDQSIVKFEQWLLTRSQAILDDIRDYNKDDCRSTHLLHEWLLEQRKTAIETFGDIPFRSQKIGDTPDPAALDQPR